MSSVPEVPADDHHLGFTEDEIEDDGFAPDDNFGLTDEQIEDGFARMFAALQAGDHAAIAMLAHVTAVRSTEAECELLRVSSQNEVEHDEYAHHLRVRYGNKARLRYRPRGRVRPVPMTLKRTTTSTTRPRERRQGSSSATSGSDPGDDPDEPEPPARRQRRHKKTCDYCGGTLVKTGSSKLYCPRTTCARRR
jgi:hypothetical protein